MGDVSRKEAVQALSRIVRKHYDVHPTIVKSGWHLGNVELREFFDEVFGPPKDETEFVDISVMEKAPKEASK